MDCYPDRNAFLNKAKKRLRDDTRYYYSLYSRNDTEFENMEERIIQSTLRGLWPLGLQTKISLQPYMGGIKDAFGCTFKRIHSDEWAQCYEFHIDGQRWTLSKGDKMHDDWLSEYYIKLNDCIRVGSPTELVQAVRFFNDLLPEFRAYVTNYVQTGRFLIERRSKISKEDRITYSLPATKAPLDPTKPYPGITEELLRRKVKEYNALYFEGKLPPCPVKLTNGLISRKKPCYAYYSAGEDTIVVDFYVTYCSSGNIRSLLLHEMIHHCIFHFYQDAFEKEKAHGATFQRIRRKLNEKYGLRIDQKMTATQKYYRISSVETAH